MLVIKEFTFDAAHQLPGHCGKCSRLHGHTYRLRVAVGGRPKDNPAHSDHGMVIDFADLKGIVKKHVLDHLDHKFIACGDEPIIKFFDDFFSERDIDKEKGYNNIFGVDGITLIGKRTTAENIAHWIFQQLLPYLPGLKYIELYETPTSCVILDKKRFFGGDD